MKMTFFFAVVIVDIFVVMGERGSRLRRFEGKRKIYRVSLKKYFSEISGSGQFWLFWKIRDRFGLLRPKVQCSVLKISSWIVLEGELICNCFCLCKAWTVRPNYLQQIAKINYNLIWINFSSSLPHLYGIYELFPAKFFCVANKLFCK